MNRGEDSDVERVYAVTASRQIVESIVFNTLLTLL
jgi:hypothetical protein